MLFCNRRKKLTFDKIRLGTEYEIVDLQIVTRHLIDFAGKRFDKKSAYLLDNAWFLLQGVVLHLLYQKKYHNFKIGADGKPEPIPGRTANLSDVLDFLYDYQDGAESDLEAEHKKFLADLKRQGKNFNPEASGADGGVGEEEAAKGIPQKRDRFFDGLDNEDYAPVCSDFTENMDAAMQPAGIIGTDDKLTFGLRKRTEEIEPSLRTWDNDFIDSESDYIVSDFHKLQKKMERYIFAYRFVMEKTEDGYWTDFAAPYCHVPDDDKELFIRLYPDKVNLYGLHPYVYQVFRSMVARSYREFSLILGMLDTVLAINCSYGFNNKKQYK